MARRPEGALDRFWGRAAAAVVVEHDGDLHRGLASLPGARVVYDSPVGVRPLRLRLYDVSAAAVKSVDPQLRIGGPASAAGNWVDELLAHCRATGTPIDFVSTHTYGNAPLDLRPIAARHGFPGLPQWWTEWGAHATHFYPVHDSPWSAAYLVRGMASAMGRTESVAYWTVSDHFEELGRPPKLLHGGFGLLSVGNLRKPRWWGLWMLEQLLSSRLATRVAGDGAGDMVQAIGSRADDEQVTIVAWNGTVDVAKAGGEPLLDRDVTLRVSGLGAPRYRLRHRRLDTTHSNLVARWAELGGGADWPNEMQWAELHAGDRLEELEPLREFAVTDGSIELSFALPMPSVSLLELEPARAGRQHFCVRQSLACSGPGLCGVCCAQGVLAEGWPPRPLLTGRRSKLARGPAFAREIAVSTVRRWPAGLDRPGDVRPAGTAGAEPAPPGRRRRAGRWA